jgi:hypothetical protein
MTYNRKDLSVQVNIKSIKGYTMREIGALEDRIKRLEYYTVLNALELDTKTLSVRDDTGNIERFKNGIFADPFNDHTLGKTEDREYRIAVDSSKSIIRPLYEELFHNFKLSNTSSSNIKVAGRLAMIDYDTEYFGGNQWATNYRNCTESFYSWRGHLQLFPNFDNVNQTTLVAPQTINIDIAGAFSDLLATGIAKDISSVTANPVQTGSSQEAWNGTGIKTTNHWSQTTTTTVKDIAVNIKPINQDLGSFVKDVSTLPYMRSRLISVVAKGLKPNTRLYMYFDRINVTDQCAPAYVSAAYATATGQVNPAAISNLSSGRENEVLTQNGNRGTAITSNQYGEAYFVFLLPPNTFRSGDRTMIVTNTDNIEAVDARLTTAEGTYTSSALSVSTQNLSFSILQPSFTPTTVVTPNTVTWDTETYWMPSDDPVAETFVINETAAVNVPGVYLTQLGVYFKRKSATLGISCVVCQTTVGIPDRDKIIGRAYLLPTSVVTSDNSSAETVFTFQTPILLQTDKTYAFWLEPDGANPDYECWISQVGGTDILTGRAITQQPYSGIMYVSSNAKSWTPVQTTDIKFKIYRAKFKYSSATAVFRNETDEFLTLSALLRANTAIPVAIGDVVYAANTSNTLQTFTNTTTHPFGIVQAIDELNGLLYLERSNGLFSTATYPNLKIYRVPEVGNASQIIITNLVANCTLGSIDNPSYHGIVPKFNVIEPIGTKLRMTFGGTSNSSSSFAKDVTYTDVKNESLYLYYDYERTLRSYSNEVDDGGYTDGTATFNINLSTENQYVSPVIDLGVKTMNFIKNEINNDYTNEDTRYGNALNKYISKNVVLTQEAEDLLVYLTGYRPNGTDIKVYGKFLNQNDIESFDSKPWSELTNQLAGSYGSPQDKEDYREYIFGIPTGNTIPNQTTAYLDPNSVDPVNVITYYDTTGSPHTGYNTFGIKILLLSDSPVNIPTLRDVRAIALQR